MNKRKALSEVISTLILLVVAVLLATVATYYATNITMTRTQMEEIQFSKEHIWVNSSGAVAAFKLQNLGGRDVLLDKITVRGVDEAWTDVFYYRVPTGTSIAADMNVTNPNSLVNGVTIGGIDYNQSTDDIPLQSGAELLVYVKNPDNVQMKDIGKSLSMSIYTSNANYITECNVESATAN
ncbi:MAG TPA: archaellin/type IV pilin N-terminal domain-containing protein [Patescibacteria group bacterium]|nr:archaellin/type IV pilin N-terminal domain-containing protein [Patescibacteria group bacterium]